MSPLKLLKKNISLSKGRCLISIVADSKLKVLEKHGIKTVIDALVKQQEFCKKNVL